MTVRQIKKYAIIVTALLTLWVGLHTVAVTIDGLRDELAPADFIVVLGNEVYADGTLSPRLLARVEKARELYEKKLSEVIVVSGGVSKAGFPEGDAMRNYLVAKGVPAEAVIVDNAGVNTRATAANMGKFATQRNWKSVLVVSQFFHISRCKLAMRKAGFREVFSAKADYFELRDLYSIVREFPAYYSYRFRGLNLSS